MVGDVPGGMERLVEMLSNEVLRRSTGAVDVGGHGFVYIVFGHPLHATLGDFTGLAAIDGIGAVLRDHPGLEVTWLAGRTAGNAHSLAPTDGVLDRLRGEQTEAYGPSRTGDGPSDDYVGDLNLRARIAEPAESPPTPDPAWTAVRGEVCTMLEATLHRHARVLTQIVTAAPANQGAILMAIERARSTPVRVVSRAVVEALLIEAEAMVRGHAGAA